jgi:MFS family permease
VGFLSGRYCGTTLYCQYSNVKKKRKQNKENMTSEVPQPTNSTMEISVASVPVDSGETKVNSRADDLGEEKLRSSEQQDSPNAVKSLNSSQEHNLNQLTRTISDGDFLVDFDKTAPVQVLTSMFGSQLYLTPHSSEVPRTSMVPQALNADEVAEENTAELQSVVGNISADGKMTASKHRKAPSLAQQKVLKEEELKMKENSRPPDGGYGWVIVGCAFFVLFAVLGSMYCFGLIYVSLLSDFGSSKATTALVGSVNLASFLLFGAPTGRLIQVIGPKRITQIGGCVAGIFLALSGSTTALWQLFLVFGVLAGFGFSLSYGPAMIIISTYFDKKRPLAVGIAVSGSGIGTLVMAQVVSVVLSNFGWRNCFRILGAIVFLIVVTAGSLYKQLPNIGSTAYSSSKALVDNQNICTELCRLDKIIDIKFLLSNRYIQCLSATMFISAFGYYVPQIHLVKYATEVGISSSKASYLVSVMGVGSTIGRLFFGKLSAGSPRKRVNLFIFSTFATGFFTCLLPLLAKAGFGGFIVFVICYGSVAGAFIAMMPVVTADLVGLRKLPRSLGLQFSAQVGTVMIGPVLVGLVADSTGSYSYAFLVSGVLLIISTIPLLIVPKLVLANPRRSKIKTLRTNAS